MMARWIVGTVLAGWWLAGGACWAAPPEMKGDPSETGAPAAARLPSAPASDAQRSPAELVRAAMMAEASGDRQARDRALGELLERDPEYGPARWLSGFVRWDGKWMAWEEVAQKTRGDSRLAEYRKLRDGPDANSLGQLGLARWCQERGLLSEARVHWMNVLETQPQNAEALKSLGMQWWNGQLLTDREVVQWKQASTREARRAVVKEERRWGDYWQRRLPGWRKGLERGERTVRTGIAAELATVEGPLALHVLGTMLMHRSQRKMEQEGCLALSLELVRCLRENTAPWAAAQLVRHAVDHPAPEVRTAAADALEKRPKEAYVPYLLWRMRLPIEANLSLVSLGTAGVMYRISMVQEGPDASFERTGDFALMATPAVQVLHDPRHGRPPDGFLPTVAAGAARARRAHLMAAGALAEAQQRLQSIAAETALVNQRVGAVLCQTVGEEFSTDPIACQRWWADYCRDYYELGESYYSSDEDPDGLAKPVYEEYTSESARYFVPSYVSMSSPRVYSRPRPANMSCFRRDTPVWTLTGKTPIQQVKPGDRVLSKHPRTGELAYKPVLQVTLRKPSPMLKIIAGSEAIFATRGHPFWVCGEGWKMAKQLKMGSRLLAVSGTVLVDGLEEIPAAGPWYEQLKERADAQPEDVGAHNLVVADFHTFFVGQQKLLVHDNVLFPFDGPLAGMPGLDAR